MKRRLVAALMTAGIIAMALASTAGTGSAAAKWQNTPRIGVMGEEIWTVGNGGSCRGSMHVGLQNSPRKPGQVQVTIRSKGFTRDKCRATIKFVFHNTVAPFNHERYFRIEGTKKRGPLLAKKQYWIGSGLDLVSITSNTPASKGVSYYIAIP